MDQVVDEDVDRVDGSGPRPADVAERSALGDLALAADHAPQALQLARHALVQLDDVVERVGDLAGDARPLHRQPGREVALFQGVEGLQERGDVQNLRGVFLKSWHESVSKGRE